MSDSSVECFLCGGPTQLRYSAVDYRRPHDKRSWPLFWCSDCQFGRIVHPDLNAETVADLYRTDYYTHGQGGDTDDDSASFLQKLLLHLAWRFDFGSDFAVDEIPPPTSPQPSVCDIGCGDGGLLKRFVEAGYTGVGIEPDDAARAQAAKNCTVLAGTAEQLPSELSGRQFDVVVLSHSLEHCLDPAVAIKNAASLLAPSGTMVIEVPNNAVRGFDTYGPSWPWSDIPRHLNFFTLESLKKLLEQHGLAVTDTKFTGFTRQYSTEWVNWQRQIAAAVTEPGKRVRIANPWFDLAAAALLKPQLKYDSMRIHAVHAR